MLREVSIDSMLTTREATCLRTLIKDLIPSKEDGISRDYVWHEMMFCCTWTANTELVTVCFDIPLGHQDLIESHFNDPVTLSAWHAQMERMSVQAFGYIHSALVDLALPIYDDSIWRIRDFIRTVELAGLPRSFSMPVCN